MPTSTVILHSINFELTKNGFDRSVCYMNFITDKTVGFKIIFVSIPTGRKFVRDLQLTREVRTVTKVETYLPMPI